MDLISLIFYVFAVVIIGSAAVTAFSKNIMYAAFGLLFTFFGVAGMYVLLNADFLAITQIMIYIGGILILIIFGVMMTSKVINVDIKKGTSGKVQIWIMSILGAFLAVMLSVMFLNTEWLTAGTPEVTNTINPIGNLLMTDYLLVFEAAAVLLLIAFIGAALIGRRQK